tara:strand:+ start:231 stop:593 length:363 start_codon:yes stop_codon:yes gene_type:complete
MDILNIRKFVCDNLSNLSENKNKLIYDYIKNNNISYSENKNGIFINVSLCDEKHINYFHKIINTININDEKEYNDKIKEDKCLSMKPLTIKNRKGNEKGIILKDINLKKIELLILKYSFE